MVELLPRAVLGLHLKVWNLYLLVYLHEGHHVIALVHIHRLLIQLVDMILALCNLTLEMVVLLVVGLLFLCLDDLWRLVLRFLLSFLLFLHKMSSESGTYLDLLEDRVDSYLFLVVVEYRVVVFLDGFFDPFERVTRLDNWRPEEVWIEGAFDANTASELIRLEFDMLNS